VRRRCVQLEELHVKHDDKMRGKEKRINQLISMERYARKQKSRLEGMRSLAPLPLTPHTDTHGELVCAR
jgi:hypothetical protein